MLFRHVHPRSTRWALAGPGRLTLLGRSQEGVRGTVVRSEARRMNRPQVAYFLSGVLAYFPSGARSNRTG